MEIKFKKKLISIYIQIKLKEFSIYISKIS